MAVRDEIAHLLIHVEAEAASNDKSQLRRGLTGRANEVRALLKAHENDATDREIKGLLVAGGDLGLQLVRTANDKALRMALVEYVGKGYVEDKGG